MDGCLRRSGRAVPYSGGGVTPVSLTPNFEFPIGVADLSNKTMTASSPVTMEDLVNGLIFTGNQGGEYGIALNSGEYKIVDGSDGFNPVTISSDGLTITFGNWSGGGPVFASFTFNP